MLDTDYDALIAAVGVAGLRRAVIEALIAAGIENAASFRYRFSRGSVVVTVIGPSGQVGAVGSAVMSGNLMVMVNNQTIAAQPADSTSPNNNNGGDDDDDSISSGAVVGIVIAVIVAVLLVAVVVSYALRSRDKGSYHLSGTSGNDDVLPTSEDEHDRRTSYIGNMRLDDDAPRVYLREYSNRLTTEV